MKKRRILHPHIVEPSLSASIKPEVESGSYIRLSVIVLFRKNGLAFVGFHCLALNTYPEGLEFEPENLSIYGYWDLIPYWQSN